MPEITIVGAGAIGGTIGAFLSQAGIDVLLVDNVPEHVEAINRHGLRISGAWGDRRYRVRACLPEEVRGPLGVVGLAVKSQHTLETLEPAVPLLADDGCVISLQNGLNEKVIADRIGAERTIGCFVHFGADYMEPGHIHFSHGRRLRLGELSGEITPRIRRLTGLLAPAVGAEFTTNIFGYLWGKMCFASVSFAAAMVDEPWGDVVADPRYRPVLAEVARETWQVARAAGVEVLAIDNFDGNAFGDGLTEAAHASFDDLVRAQDRALKQFSGIQRDIMVRRRPTEVDHQPGAVVREAERLGLSAPYNRRIVEMIRELEQCRRPLGRHNLDELQQTVGRR